MISRARKHQSVVAGGGAAEMEVSRFLRDHANTVQGKQQLIIRAFAKALEAIPKNVADNAGFDSISILNKLRQKHAGQGGQWFGVDIENEGICNTFESLVWEPTLVKTNSISSATEAACTILSIDETVTNDGRGDVAAPGQLPGGMGRGRGRGGPPMMRR